MKSTKCIVTMAILALLLGGTAAAQPSGHFQGNFRASHMGAYWMPHLTADVSLGWRFNKWVYTGVATGGHFLQYSYRDPYGEMVDEGWAPAIPLCLDAVGYLPLPRRMSAFYLGAEAGGMYVLSKDYPQRAYFLGALKTGFDIAVSDRFGITLGVLFLSTFKSDFNGLAISTGFRF